VLGNYNITYNTASFTINKADPIVTAWPMASAITSGQQLSASILTGGSATPSGVFAFTFPFSTPSSASPREVTFTPNDQANYNTAPGMVTVTAN